MAEKAKKSETEEKKPATSENESVDSSLIQLSGMWLNESNDGKTKYMAGYLGSAKLLMFKNKFKREDKHPDYVLYVAPNVPKSDDDDKEDIPF